MSYITHLFKPYCYFNLLFYSFLHLNFLPSTNLTHYRSLSSYDKEVLKRINDIEHLPNEDKQHIFYLIDNLVKAVKLNAI